MRKISADHIFPVSSAPIPNGTILIDDDGMIISVSGGTPDADAERYNGIICPGFINTHCHLELSHMRGRIREKAGMNGFVRELLSIRPGFSAEEIGKGIEEAEAEMIRNGIVAVGDISNDSSSFLQKAKGNLKYHTFIEVFDLDPARTASTIETAIALRKELHSLQTSQNALECSIVPHAPYTVTEGLFAFISAEARAHNSIISIHNQESKGESELFQSGSGPMFEAFSKMGINMQHFPVTDKNSLRTTLPKLPSGQNTLLVHNTFSSREDIHWAEKQMPSHLFWCTCPNANLYIEDTLPDYTLFLKENVNVTIGTDSLASNRSLSILDELKVISAHSPQIPLTTLLAWATKNGAEFLGLPEFGTIEKGKRPGLNLISGLQELSLTSESTVRRIA